MTREEMAKIMDKVFDECRGLRDAGQKEYAHREDNPFANFERVGERIGVSRESVLMVYCEKHIDGVHSWIKGHRSQREGVEGRINDVIVYMTLLRGMIEQSRLRQGVSTLCQTDKHVKCNGGTVVGECACSCHERPKKEATEKTPTCLAGLHAVCHGVNCACSCHPRPSEDGK